MLLEAEAEVSAITGQSREMVVHYAQAVTAAVLNGGRFASAAE